jgi:ribulose-phosphate 3-epimerase
MNGKISPSIMCADFRSLESQIRALESLGIEYLHFDVMDGHFVPNFTMGPDILNTIRKLTKIPLDIHLMVEKPEDYINLFKPCREDIVTVHQECTYHLQRVVQSIKQTGAKAGVALNPSTTLSTIQYVLEDIDVVLIMTVNPGFAGQKLVPATLNKIKEMNDIIIKYQLPIEIEVDGNVSFENAVKMRTRGADIFVGGTSSVFNRNMGIEAAVARLREAINLDKTQLKL